MFVGREMELQTLEEVYASDRFEFTVLYGRRRIGKTALLNAFASGKKVVQLTGIENSAAVNLRNLEEAVRDVYAGLPEQPFSSFRQAAEFLFKQSEREKVVLIIDEYPYVARSDNTLASTLQMLIDRHKDHSKLKLILCGSSMSFMEDEVLAYKAPLYGRRTGQIRVRPFDFAHSRQFVPEMAPDEQLTVYAATGGIPAYLREFDDTLNLRDNLIRAFLRPSSVLYGEPESLIRQELGDPAEYSPIFSAIVGGASRFSQIISKANVTVAEGERRLRQLMELGLVSRKIPFGTSFNAKKAIWFVTDGAFRFWYRFVQPNMSRIERGDSARAFERIKSQLNDFAARTFEEVCAEYLWHMSDIGRCEVDFQELGAWWGTDPRTQRAEEIDIVGADGSSVLTAECKWRSESTGVDVLHKLRERTALVAEGAKPHLYLFSRSGFTEACREQAQRDGDVTLVAYPEIVSALTTSVSPVS